MSSRSAVASRCDDGNGRASLRSLRVSFAPSFDPEDDDDVTDPTAFTIAVRPLTSALTAPEVSSYLLRSAAVAVAVVVLAAVSSSSSAEDDDAATMGERRTRRNR